MSFYNKYRPQNFANLVGQDHIRQTLLHEIQKCNLAHAYLFAGPRGTGKTSTARLIAKTLNCTNKNEEGEPCDECEFCTAIKDGSLIDVIEIDAASNRGIDEIRDLREKIQFAPTRTKTKIYIIDEVHMLTKEAFNALLKTLEEPPENVFFILCTTEIHKIPETIISRCQRFDFKRIDIKTIMTRLNYIAQMEGIEAQDSAIELIARHVEGGLRDAIGLLEQMIIEGKLNADHVRSHLGITGHSTTASLIDLLEKKELAKAIHIINEVHNEGYDLNEFMREIFEHLRELLIEAIQQSGDQTKSDLWLRMINIFEESREMQRNAVIPQLPLEIAAIKICGADAEITNSSSAEPAEGRQKSTEKKEKIIKEKTIGEVKETPEAQMEEEKTAKELKKEFEMERYEGDMLKHWPRVLEHIQPPSLKRSLSDAKIAEADSGDLILKFGSRFHMEKVHLTENRAKIEKIIEHIFGKSVKISCELEENGAPKKTSAKAQKSSEDMAKKAMEIFSAEE